MAKPAKLVFFTVASEDFSRVHLETVERLVEEGYAIDPSTIRLATCYAPDHKQVMVTFFAYASKDH